MTSEPSWARRLGGAVVVLAVALAVVTTRAVTEGDRLLRDADAAIRRQDWSAAAVQSRAAASWYVPGAPHVAGAYARLLHVARTTEALHERDAALFAWRAMRAAAEQTGWLLQPHAHERELADQGIARLAADEALPPPRDEANAKLREQLLAQLAPPEAPRPAAVATLLAGLWLAAAGLGWLLVREGDEDESRRWSRRQAPGAVALAGLLLYAVALWRA